jgi:hypothetical protein
VGNAVFGVEPRDNKLIFETEIILPVGRISIVGKVPRRTELAGGPT